MERCREVGGFKGKQWVQIPSLKWKCTAGDTFRKMDMLFEGVVFTHCASLLPYKDAVNDK